MDIHPYVIQYRSELGSKSYIFIEMTKLFHKSFSAFTICINFICMNNQIYITIFNEKFQNKCKEQTNNKVPSNILPLYKTSS